MLPAGPFASIAFPSAPPVLGAQQDDDGPMELAGENANLAEYEESGYDSDECVRITF